MIDDDFGFNEEEYKTNPFLLSLYTIQI